jgi:hypothetical protein
MQKAVILFRIIFCSLDAGLGKGTSSRVDVDVTQHSPGSVDIGSGRVPFVGGRHAPNIRPDAINGLLCFAFGYLNALLLFLHRQGGKSLPERGLHLGNADILQFQSNGL